MLLDRYVALDLETTGLNPRQDFIIEVGMIKVRDGRIIDTFHNLVRPEIKIPLRIKKLTGIDDGMLAGAPRFQQIKDGLAAFIEGEAILGHSVGFDLSFLEQWLGRSIHNRAYDTLELARIAMPSARSHRLADLCLSAGLEAADTWHRALDDARAVVALYEYLVKCIYRLDGPVAVCLDSLLKKAGSSWGGVISASAGFLPGKQYHFPDWAGQVLEGRGGDYREAGGWGFVEPDRVRDLLSGGGLLERNIPSFQYRFQQAEMAAEVARALNEKKFLLVEAGTGTGKSTAYLIPSILWTAAGGPRVVISTGTINLQDQLWYKDMPQLLKCLGLNIKAVLAKGRSNYICLRRWQAALSEGPAPGREAFFYARVLGWLNETKSGDRVELNLNAQEEEFWLNICADSDSCPGSECRYHHGSCFVVGARREAESSGLIITNHALLFSDIKTGNMVLPDYGPLIIDEAHHLEDAATEQLGRQVSRRDVRRWLNTGGKIVARCWGLVPGRDQEVWVDCLVSLREGLERMKAATEVFYGLIINIVYRDNPFNEGEYVTCRIKGSEFWGDSQGPLWAQYRNYTFEVRSVLGGLRKIMGLMQAWAVENDSWGDRLKDVMQLVSTGEEMLDSLDFNFNCLDESFVFWISASGQGEWHSAALHSSPVRVGELLYEKLFSARESVVMTSATLSVNGSFDFFTERVGIDRVFGSKVVKKNIESPFLYESQSLLCLVSDLPHQGSEAQRRYVEAVGSALKDLIMAVGGKTLVLFTSHRVLREVYGHVKESLEENDISVLGHNIDGNRHRLVEEFKQPGRSVLMGAASFWEGIDIPGEALTCVIIVKLPFASPSVPVLEARMEDLETAGRSSFYDYYLPLAAIKFKQGFGRLIRTEKDRGVVVVLDRRILEKGYGRYFLGSLPKKEYFSGNLIKVRKRIIEWLNGKI